MAEKDHATIGVIGGSGVYQMEGLTQVKEIKDRTPFGDPSDVIVLGNLGDTRVAFLPRHGRGHRIMPSELPVRANIYALRSLGVERIISISACGSLREDFAPLDIVIPDQLYDRTKNRPTTFFGDGLVVHISFADPFCPELSNVLYSAAQKAGARVHKGGAYLVIDGPQFSTKAESESYRQMKMDIIGMTAIPEAKLAREAEICYATIAMVTDYDVWHPSHDSVTVEMVVQNLLKNAEMGKRIVRYAVDEVPSAREQCPCPNALRDAIITARDRIPYKSKRTLGLLLDKYLPKPETLRPTRKLRK
ncbi:MAG: S-methyl-5'-thioadenosine phosphorylase [Chloroflexi bacterium]|nr:S-methyl-5'-thioadenosine phosphorylase [Chloroflexota bacterium]